MNPEKFIIDELEKFIRDFSKVRIRYEHDEMSRSHFVEIVPNSIFRSDSCLRKWKHGFWDKFVAFYPTENICFISDDALVGIENVIYAKEGLDYAPISTAKESITFDPLSVLLQQAIVKGEMNITFAETETDNSIETTRVPDEYSSQTYLLAA
jgi:hypothetical protein